MKLCLVNCVIFYLFSVLSAQRFGGGSKFSFSFSSTRERREGAFSETRNVVESGEKAEGLQMFVSQKNWVNSEFQAES